MVFIKDWRVVISFEVNVSTIKTVCWVVPWTRQKGVQKKLRSNGILWQWACLVVFASEATAYLKNGSWTDCWYDLTYQLDSEASIEAHGVNNPRQFVQLWMFEGLLDQAGHLVGETPRHIGNVDFTKVLADGFVTSEWGEIGPQDGLLNFDGR